jgi:hypothetical protein
VDIIFGNENAIVKTSKCLGCLDIRGVQVLIVTDKRGHYLHQLRLEVASRGPVKLC